MALARIRQLSAHEVGHTLGFTHNFAASTISRASVMDYPHPQIYFKEGKIDFSNAYATGIGEWDKVTVAYSYQDFATNEVNELPQILEKAFANGLRFISDQDARPKGGAHAYGHLWDNGSDISDELVNVLNIRAKAIEKFSVDNIKSSQPYAVLEDVFVPLFFFHRYQTEAVSKLIGGLDYNYAVKGGNQTIIKRISGIAERKALRALLKTIDVKTMAVPERVLALFPPRAIGYSRTRESFTSKSGVAFDPFGSVETASEMTLELLFHPERVARLIQHKSLDGSQLGFDEVIDLVIQNSFKKNHKSRYHQELQNVVNTQVLNQLFYLAANENSYQQVKAIVNAKLDDITKFLKTLKSSGVQKMYDTELIKNIDSFKKNPSKFKKTKTPKIPDGSPIGMD